MVQDYRHGRTVSFRCSKGYQIIGAASITCNNGTWDSQVPVCKGLNNFALKSDKYYLQFIRDLEKTIKSELLVLIGICRRPNTPYKGRLHGNSFLDGDEVTFSCERNYDLFGDITLRCFGRKWNAEVPLCKGGCLVFFEKFSGEKWNYREK